MSGRCVVITGATGGLGHAIVEAFEQAGDTVAAFARSSPEFSADLTKPEEAAGLVSRVLEKHGQIDVLVHAMGGFAADGPVQTTKDDTWRRMMSMNVDAALYICRAVVPPMIEARRGRIVAVGSRAGVQPGPGMAAYSASKAALNSLIQSIAAEVTEYGITANVVLPSTIDTEANRKWGTPEQIATWVQPKSIAEVILWLASDGAGDVNGALVPVYGRA
jgi:NAD(P)-dependent dehydrogenase (short-subunit alcohol dehydrogenase family)